MYRPMSLMLLHMPACETELGLSFWLLHMKGNRFMR